MAFQPLRGTHRRHITQLASRRECVDELYKVCSINHAVGRIVIGAGASYIGQRVDARGSRAEAVDEGNEVCSINDAVGALAAGASGDIRQ